MRGNRAKALKKVARWERAAELNVVEHSLVQDKRGVIHNAPHSIRKMYLQLKAAFKATVRKVGARTQFDRGISEDAMQRLVTRLNASPAKPAQRKTKPAPARARTCIADASMRIQKPLRVISDHCPPTEIRNQAGNVVDYLPHPTLVYARRLANAGNGAAVQVIAQSLLAA